MFKFRKINNNLNSEANYGVGKRIVPKLQWYLLAIILCLPVIYLFSKILYDNFYPHATGVVVAEEFTLTSSADSYVNNVFVVQGQNIVAKQPLINFVSPIFESQINELKQQLSNLIEEKNQYVNYELITLQKIKLQAWHQVEEAKKYYNNLLVYRKEGVVTILQMNEARMQYINAQHQYQMVLSKIAQNQKDFAVNKIQVFDNDIHRLQLEIVARVEQNKLLNIISPVDGAVKDISVHQGEFVSKDKPVMILSSSRHFRVVAFMEAKYLNKIKIGRRVRLLLPNKQITMGIVENMPQFTDRLYKGIDLVNSKNQQKIVLVIKPDINFPQAFKINGIEIEVLL